MLEWEKKQGLWWLPGAQMVYCLRKEKIPESWAMLKSHKATPPTYTEHFSNAELMKLDILVFKKKERGKVKGHSTHLHINIAPSPWPDCPSF